MKINKMRNKRYKYMGKQEINRFNRNTKTYKDLFNFIRVLTHKLGMEEDGYFDENELCKILDRKEVFWREERVRKMNLHKLKQIPLFCTISPKDYVRIQWILIEITKKPWAINDLIRFLLGWFIYTYEKDLSKIPINIKFPFYKTNNSFNKRFENLEKFNEKFRKYYKNIMK